MMTGSTAAGIQPPLMDLAVVRPAFLNLLHAQVLQISDIAPQFTPCTDPRRADRKGSISDP